jgi:small subunit ribosomal protein S3
MGRKVHPIGMRLGINQGWQGRWFAEGSQYRQQLHQDFAIRSLLLGITSKGGSAKIPMCESFARNCRIRSRTARLVFHASKLSASLERSVLQSTQPSPVS